MQLPCLIWMEIISVQYERVLSPGVAVGIIGAHNFNQVDNFRGMILPYVRYYLSKSTSTTGFFAEGNAGIVFSDDDLLFDGVITNSSTALGEERVGFGAGVNIGYKRNFGGKFLVEAFIGIGGEFNKASSVSGFPNLGINGGYRF